MSNFLLEIGLEEMPAHVVSPSLKQLEEKTVAFLKDQQLDFETIKTFATPRRLALQITGLPEKQADTKEEAKGPAKKIALDENGNWTKAALGFVRGKGLTPEDIYFKEIKGVEYLHVTKFNEGKATADVLLGLKEVITSLTFPVTMHWADYDFAYIRPIHWLMALLDDKILPLQILDIKAGRTSRGHRFLGEEATVSDPLAYEQALEKEYVIVDPNKRKAMISQQILSFETKNNWKIDLDEDLLEEVNNLVEYPTAFVGSFAEKYLSIPKEVLVTSMKEHQRYFEVWDQNNQLLPYFVSVRNGNDQGIENVIKGNEKVLTARLEDAEFFYQEDQKLTIDACVEKLKHVTFHEKIGSMYEKMQRVTVLAELLGNKVGLNKAELASLKEACGIYKFDLVTNMVGEFPELQGIMGEKYALLQGKSEVVSQSIREHYMPISAEGALPESKVGTVLAVADKLDSLLTFFNVGLKPSGSNDPYALRRQAYGILRILAKEKWHFSFLGLLKEATATYNQDPQTYGLTFETPLKDLFTFVKDRLRQFFQSKAVRHDVIDAVVESHQEDLTQMMEAVEVLKNHLHDDNFKGAMEALTRVVNLSKKAETTKETVDPALFENDSEKALYEAVKEIKQQAATSLEKRYEALMTLQKPIEDYFDATMVMAQDKDIKNNRLTQLNEITQLMITIGSFDRLNTK